MCGLEGELLLIYDISLTSQTARWGADTLTALKARIYRASRVFFGKLPLKWESPLCETWLAYRAFLCKGALDSQRLEHSLYCYAGGEIEFRPPTTDAD